MSEQQGSKPEAGTPGGPGATDLDFGIAENTSDNFRLLVHFMAGLPQYGGMPLNRVSDFELALRNDRVMVARKHRLPVGIAVWTHVSDELALKCIDSRSFPQRGEVLHEGEAVLLLALGTTIEGVAAPLAREVFERQRGRIVLYERTVEAGSDEDRFVWLDRKGVRMGDALLPDNSVVH